MLSLDMTGGDTAQTGGTFLIEKSPDPSALWERPSDPHSEWGAGQVDPASVRGSFLNDLHLAVSLRRARVEKTSPAEMQHVGIAVATTARYLSSAGHSEVAPMTRLMEAAREARMATERQNNATPEILEAWRKWYVEAIASVERLR